MVKQSQEHQHNGSNTMRMVAGLLVVGALVLTACSKIPVQIGILAPAVASTKAATLVALAPTDCTPGNAVDKTAFFTGVIQALQNPSVPVSDFAIKAFLAWEPQENTAACWNPLATTWGMPGSTNFNSVGVQNYPDQATGILATANTLNQTWDFYHPIRTMLAKQGFDETALTQALVKWVGSSAYADTVVAQWKILYNQ